VVRYLAIGDIHGCFNALTTLIEFVAPGSDDVLITLGDYVNRGPDSCAVLDWLIGYNQQGNLVALRGNHEVMMMRARSGIDAFGQWIKYGGNATLASYPLPTNGVTRLTDIPDNHWYFLEQETRRWFEIDSHFFVHASAYPDIPLDEQPDLILFWEGIENPSPHESGKIMVCGHIPQQSGRPRNIGHAVFIDTGACSGGWLTCLDVVSGEYWQANEQGETRSGRIDIE
jgi:serine/threonine protein phosphatase 1